MRRPRHVRYGAGTGPLAVYFHGCPGAPEECARFDGLARALGVRLVGLDRGGFAPGLAGEAYFEALAAEVTTLAEGAPAHVLGFSLGGFVALRTAVHLKGGSITLDLISAAAPLEAGDFLDGMQGKAVFQTASRSPVMFRRLTALQGWLAGHAPHLLHRMLFSKAAGADRALAVDPEFRREIDRVLRLSLIAGAAGYVRDVGAYIQPWSDRLPAVAARTRIWHGAEDNWSPPAMAACLETAMPGVAGLEILSGLSHYSCLHAALPRILERIGEGAP